MLMLALSVSSHAGEMGQPVIPPPPPPDTTQSSTEPATGGEMGQPRAVPETGIALSLLETLLALL